MSYEPTDEQTCTRSEMRQAALDAIEMAERLREQAEERQAEPDWEQVAYWQRDALVHALLAVTAGDRPS